MVLVAHAYAKVWVGTTGLFNTDGMISDTW
jgi:hypothetical protein